MFTPPDTPLTILQILYSKLQLPEYAFVCIIILAMVEVLRYNS
jgi:hypothetical protein